MSDNRFYDSQKYDDKIYGTRYNEICPIVDRFITINPYEGGCDINIDLISILGEVFETLSSIVPLMVDQEPKIILIISAIFSFLPM